MQDYLSGRGWLQTTHDAPYSRALSEHALQPAEPVAAPAPRVSATPGGGAVAFAGVAEPGHVLALQRTAGNRAVTRLLGRTKKEPSGAAVPISAGDVTHTGGTPTASTSRPTSPSASSRT
jgi:hypothetical protein